MSGLTQPAVNWDPAMLVQLCLPIQTLSRVSASSYLRGLLYGPVQLELSIGDREDSPES